MLWKGIRKASFLILLPPFILLIPAVLSAVVVNETAKLLASDGAADDAFGFRVSLSGDRAGRVAIRHDSHIHADIIDRPINVINQ